VRKMPHQRTVKKGAERYPPKPGQHWQAASP